MPWNAAKSKVRDIEPINLTIISSTVRFNFGRYYLRSTRVTGLDVCARLSIQRLRILQQKKEAQAKASRRDIATLLERSKVETARVKVEASMHYLTLPDISLP
jgi:Regulator of Vps4 activity in the MVB pathway